MTLLVVIATDFLILFTTIHLQYGGDVFLVGTKFQVVYMHFYLISFFIADKNVRLRTVRESKLYEKTISNMLECKSRGAYLMGLTTYGKYEIEDQVNFTVYVPKVDEHFVGSLAVIPLQLLGYYVSIAKGLDVDKPRNLAKSVTVE